MEGYTLKKWESTLNLAFMPMDTMYNLSWKLLVKIITPLVISSSCIRGSIIYDRGFWPCSPLNTISRASLSTCLLQSNTPVQPLLWFVVEYYPPGISRLSRNCITSYEFFIKCYILIDSNFSRALSYLTLKDTDNWLESASRLSNSW